MSGHVFLSYAREDSTYVRRLAAHLQQAGVVVWFDDAIDYGDDWQRVIREQIESCAAMVVVMSPAAQDSDWVSNEISWARAHSKPVLTLLLSGLPLFALGKVHHEDVTDGRMPSAGFVAKLPGAKLVPAPRPTVVRQSPQVQPGVEPVAPPRSPGCWPSASSSR